MDTMQSLQLGTHIWRERNFPESTAEDQLIGCMEELGELSHAFLKGKQKIRGMRNVQSREAKEKDAIGDLVIYLMGFCSKRGYDFSAIVRDTTAMVTERDWIENPQDGGEVAPS